MSPAEVIEVAKIFVLAVAVLNGVIDLVRMARWLVHKIAPVLLRVLKKEIFLLILIQFNDFCYLHNPGG